MRKILYAVLCSMAIWCTPACASYVNSGHQDFATASSTACNPDLRLGGTVVSGDAEVMAVQANSTTTVSISSTRVSSWTQDAITSPTGSVMLYLWHGFAGSSGAESITVSFSSGSALIGSACGEYNSTTFDAAAYSGTAGVGVTTSHATEDLVAFGTSGLGSTSINSPFTQRETIQLSGTTYAVLGDRSVTSTGTYTATFGGGGGQQSEITSLYGGSGGGGGTTSTRRAQVIRFRPYSVPDKPRRTL